jgi:hypothetical protein
MLASPRELSSHVTYQLTQTMSTVAEPLRVVSKPGVFLRFVHWFDRGALTRSSTLRRI